MCPKLGQALRLTSARQLSCSPHFPSWAAASEARLRLVSRDGDKSAEAEGHTMSSATAKLNSEQIFVSDYTFFAAFAP